MAPLPLVVNAADVVPVKLPVTAMVPLLAVVCITRVSDVIVPPKTMFLLDDTLRAALLVRLLLPPIWKAVPVCVELNTRVPEPEPYAWVPLSVATSDVLAPVMDTVTVLPAVKESIVRTTPVGMLKAVREPEILLGPMVKVLPG